MMNIIYCATFTREDYTLSNPLLILQVTDVRSNLNQIGFDVGSIREMVSGLVGYYSFLNTSLELLRFE